MLKKIIILITVIVLGVWLCRYLYDKTNQKNTSALVVIKTVPVLSLSVCDEVLKQADLVPVKIYDDKPAKVDFSTNPDAKMFYIAITEQASESLNFAGHFAFTSWGCGTDCAGYAIVDSITGKVVEYMPFNEDGNSYSLNDSSRLFVLNPKEDFERYRGKTIDEIIKDDSWYARLVRTYYELVEDDSGEVWINKVCSENALDGVYATGNKEISYGITPVVASPVTYYAKVKVYSSSGSMKFYWYDPKTKLIVEPDDLYSWFWAIPADVPQNETTTDNWVEYLRFKGESVLKITGYRLADDCDYYGPDHCIQNINIKTIEEVGTSKSMAF